MGNHYSLGTAPAHEDLLRLARAPFDLTADGAVDGDRLQRFRASAAGFELFYGTERLGEEVLAALASLADQCGLVDQFRAMRRGAVMNRIEGYGSENRQVLHTACRDVFSDTPAEPAASAGAVVELEKLRDFLADLEAGRLLNEQGLPFDTMIQVGIGGSDLGPRAVFEALRAHGLPNRKVCFVANVDPDHAAAVLSSVDLSTSLINVVSKSGTTLETATNEALVRAALERSGLDPSRHCLCVTGAGSPMDNPDRYLRSFYMTESVGGRYSATSMVGLVTLGFALGYRQVLEFLRGASEMDQSAEETDLRVNPALLMALIGIWNRNYLGHSSLAILPYSQALHRFPAHLQQCDMESNGKSVTRNGLPVAVSTGPVVWGEPGTNGQHAFYQLLHQGTEIVPVEFIGFRRSQYGTDLEYQGSSSQDKLVANLLAQSLALALGRASENPNKAFTGNRPSLLLLAERLDPRTMGALLALYEAKIVFQGFCWNINSFDQEGVQLGKVLATEILTSMQGLQAGSGGIGEEYVVLAGVGQRNTSRK